jgi:serine protease
VTSTVVQTTGNAKGLTGLAYRVKVMPVRILNKREKGNASDLARGIRYAVKHGADVINLSIQSGPQVKVCPQVPGVCRALRRAHKHGVSVVGAAGNEGRDEISFPSAVPSVIAVGGTTYSSCIARYSNYGEGLDLVAPGGGAELSDGAKVTENPGCGSPERRPIVQFSLKPGAAAAGNYRRFGFVGLHGTSMATAHVSAGVALVIASDIVGSSPDAVADRLKCTATPLGADGRDDFYGDGLLNAAAATDPATGCKSGP